MIKILGVALIAVAVVSGCTLFGVSGSGPVQTEARPLAAFTRIEASHGIDVEVGIGPTQSVEVRAQTNVLPLITTTSEAGTLRIAVSSPIAPSTETVVAIVVPALEAITLSGGTSANVTDLAASAIAATLSGGSVLTATGAVEAATIGVSGGSRANLLSLTVVTMVVEASGGSVVEAQVTGEIRGSASGGSRVSVAGQGVLNVEASGGANVERVP